MAQKMTVTLIDDIDGTPIEEGTGETIKFALDNSSYEIDLNADNAKKLRDFLADYVKAGRSTGRGSSDKAPAKRGGGRTDLAAIRAWANDNGHKVSERGRVPQTVIEAYDADHS